MLNHHTKPLRWVWTATGVIVSAAILFYAFIYIYERPGGIADWRLSRALGQSETIQIPLGDTPEDAVGQFRRSPSAQMIHREAVDGGMLLFYKRLDDQDSNNLQVEYTRKTWLGWKWVWGGGYGIGNVHQAKSALNYMGIPVLKKVPTPFPIVFGDVLNPSVKKVNVEAEGTGEGTYHAQIIEIASGERIWFAFLPSAAVPSYDIKVWGDKNVLIAEKNITDLQDMGPIDLKNGG